MRPRARYNQRCMGKLIAVAGKGGTGKTTVAALTVRHLIETNRTPVLAVDADPNYTLGDALGIRVEKTIGKLREEFFGERAQIPPGMTKEAVLERNMHAALEESKGVDLLVMGRQEGPGCYCYLNNILRRFLETLSSDYRFVVVDNEAGMEHLSRRNTRKIDLLLVVSDHSVKAARAVGRIAELTDELKLDVAKKYLILNRAPSDVAPDVRAEVERAGVPLLLTLPDDAVISRADAAGAPLLSTMDAAPAARLLGRALDSVL
ncbi:MAG: AAA family ATPase [Deltaproteobacteria bacterium]|nr:AAA family ATPase [Deltaproteobacteria bacterium]